MYVEDCERADRAPTNNIAAETTKSETVRPIFQMADQASYSDLHFEESDLRQWREIIVNELAEKN